VLGFQKFGEVKLLKNFSAQRAALFLAALAVVSALVSNFFPYVPTTDNFPTLGGAPVLPGIYFGLVLWLGVHLWEKKGPLALAVILVGVVIAWILAWRTAISVSEFLNQFHAGDITESRKFPYVYAIAGVVAGLVGSLGTVIAVSLVSPDFREHSDWLRTIAIGTVTGALLHFGDTPYETFLPLFIVWQGAVAASVGYGLFMPPKPARKR
jgi:hypothetical protein